MRRISITLRGVAASGALLLAAACGNSASDALAGTGASPDGGAAWGPLAVVEQAAGAEALISGTLQIEERCVLLDERGEAVLLVWPSTTTTWDSSTATVTFATPDGQRVALRDGDTVTFSGGGSSVAEGDVSAEEFLASTEWVQAPSPGCVTGSRWSIGDLVSTG